MTTICRTCLNSIKPSAPFFNIFGESRDPSVGSIHEKLQACVPEIEAELISNPVLCGTCTGALCRAYAFRTVCLKTEEKIYDYLEVIQVPHKGNDIAGVFKWMQSAPTQAQSISASCTNDENNATPTGDAIGQNSTQKNATQPINAKPTEIVNTIESLPCDENNTRTNDSPCSSAKNIRRESVSRETTSDTNLISPVPFDQNKTITTVTPIKIESLPCDENNTRTSYSLRSSANNIRRESVSSATTRNTNLISPVPFDQNKTITTVTPIKIEALPCNENNARTNYSLRSSANNIRRESVSGETTSNTNLISPVPFDRNKTITTVTPIEIGNKIMSLKRVAEIKSITRSQTSTKRMDNDSANDIISDSTSTTNGKVAEISPQNAKIFKKGVAQLIKSTLKSLAKRSCHNVGTESVPSNETSQTASTGQNQFVQTTVKNEVGNEIEQISDSVEMESESDDQGMDIDTSFPILSDLEENVFGWLENPNTGNYSQTAAEEFSPANSCKYEDDITIEEVKYELCKNEDFGGSELLDQTVPTPVNANAGMSCHFEDFLKFEQQFEGYTINELYAQHLVNLPACFVLLTPLSEAELQKWTRKETGRNKRKPSSSKEKGSRHKRRRRDSWKRSQRAFVSNMRGRLAYHMQLKTDRECSCTDDKHSLMLQMSYSKETSYRCRNCLRSCFKCSNCNFTTEYHSRLVLHIQQHQKELSIST